MALNCGGRPPDNTGTSKGNSYLMLNNNNFINNSSSTPSTTCTNTTSNLTMASDQSMVTAAGLLPSASTHLLAGPCSLVNGFQFRAVSSAPMATHSYYQTVQQLGCDGNSNNMETGSLMHHDDSSMDMDHNFLNHPVEKKRRLTNEQVKSLEESFENESKLEPERKNQLAQELGLQPRQVAVWFQNRRARCKTKQLERDYGILKAQYDAVRSEKDKLEAEVTRLRDLLSNTQSASSKACNSNPGTDGNDDIGAGQKIKLEQTGAVAAVTMNIEQQQYDSMDDQEISLTPKHEQNTDVDDVVEEDADDMHHSPIKGNLIRNDVKVPDGPLHKLPNHDGEAALSSDYSDQTDVLDAAVSCCKSPIKAQNNIPETMLVLPSVSSTAIGTTVHTPEPSVEQVYHQSSHGQHLDHQYNQLQQKQAQYDRQHDPHPQLQHAHQPQLPHPQYQSFHAQQQHQPCPHQVQPQQPQLHMKQLAVHQQQHQHHQHQPLQLQQPRHFYTNNIAAQLPFVAPGGAKLPLCTPPQLFLQHMIAHVKLEEGFLPPDSYNLYNEHYSFHNTSIGHDQDEDQVSDSMLCFNSWPHES